MSEIVFKTYMNIPLNEQEAFRYMRVKGSDETLKKLFDDCLMESKDHFSYKVCFCEFPLIMNNEEIDLGFAKVKSRALSINLKCCEKIVLFAATVGHDIDRLIKKEELLSTSKAVCLQALGSERVESLCDYFNNELKDEYSKLGYSLKPRFSPGYGDLSLKLQKEIMAVLDCKKLLGISLGESLMMTPSKSVTAIIGVYKNSR